MGLIDGASATSALKGDTLQIEILGQGKGLQSGSFDDLVNTVLSSPIRLEPSPESDALIKVELLGADGKTLRSPGGKPRQYFAEVKDEPVAFLGMAESRSTWEGVEAKEITFYDGVGISENLPCASILLTCSGRFADLLVSMPGLSLRLTGAGQAKVSVPVSPN